MNGRILIAGASGLIGSNLAKRLYERGHILRLTAHRTTIQSRGWFGVDTMWADLHKPEDCAAACAGIDTVYLCAAYSTGAADIARRPLVHVTPNVLINTLMLEAAHAAGVRKFIFVSSCVGYPAQVSPLREEMMWMGHPPGVYFAAGHMKRYAEILCRTYAEFANPPMQCVVVRPSNVYGPGDKFDYGKCHVVPALIRRVVERHNPLEIWGTGGELRDLLYVDDCVDGMIAAANTDEPFATYNLCAGECHTVRDVLDTICDLEGFHPEYAFDQSKPQTLPARRVDGDKAYRKLGFTPRVTLREGLRRTIDWYRSTR